MSRRAHLCTGVALTLAALATSGTAFAVLFAAALAVLGTLARREWLAYRGGS